MYQNKINIQYKYLPSVIVYNLYFIIIFQMKKIGFLLLLTYIIYIVQNVKIFLLGGAMDDDQQDIYNGMAKATNRTPNPNNCDDNWDTTNCPRVAVVTSASPSTQDGDDQYYIQDGSMSFEEIFKFYGFTPKHITAHYDNYFVHSNISTPEGQKNLQILLQADLIYFNGGDQSRHSRTWLNDDGSCNPIFCQVVDRTRKNLVVLGGTSAGTMIMGNPTYGGGSSFGQLYFHNSYHLAKKQVKDGSFQGSSVDDIRNGTEGLLYDYNGGKMPGFGFVADNIMTDSHFDRRYRLGRLIPALNDCNKTIGIGVDQNAAIYYNDNQGEVLGRNGVFIVDSREAIYSSRQYFDVKNVRVHYLTAGDKINFDTLEVQSAKNLIKVPKFNNYTDSDDIFSRYQMTTLILRLIDQTGQANTGLSTIPEDFPPCTPTFEFVFKKDQKTKGYYSNEIYTAQNVLVSINWFPNNNSSCVAQSKNGLSTGSIVGIVIGSLVGVFCIVGGVFYCVRRCRINTQQFQQANLKLYSQNRISNTPDDNQQGHSNIELIDYERFIYDDFRDNCALCLKNKCNIITACKHYFHVDCLKQWIDRNQSCPICNNIAVINVLLVVCMKCKNKAQVISLRQISDPLIRSKSEQCDHQNK